MVEYLLFTAEWSAMSKQLENTIETFGGQFLEGKTFVLKPYPDEHAENAIRVWPTLVKKIDGVEVARKVGPMDLIGLVEFTQ